MASSFGLPSHAADGVRALEEWVLRSIGTENVGMAYDAPRVPVRLSYSKIGQHELPASSDPVEKGDIDIVPRRKCSACNLESLYHI